MTAFNCGKSRCGVLLNWYQHLSIVVSFYSDFISNASVCAVLRVCLKICGNSKILHCLFRALKGLLGLGSVPLIALGRTRWAKSTNHQSTNQPTKLNSNLTAILPTLCAYITPCMHSQLRNLSGSSRDRNTYGSLTATKELYGYINYNPDLVCPIRFRETVGPPHF